MYAFARKIAALLFNPQRAALIRSNQVDVAHAGLPGRVTRITWCVAVITLAGSAHAPAGELSLPRHSVLGASVADANEGVAITGVLPNDAADRAGLHAGDVVTAIGVHAVRLPSEFISRVKEQPAGTPVVFEVRRSNSEVRLPVVLASATDEQDAVVKTLYRAIDVDGSFRRTLVTVHKDAHAGRPGMLIVGGIGCFSVDNAGDPEDAYMRLARDASRRGIVVMRIEKSGVGDSQGPPCITVDLLTEMHSYEVALAAMLRDPAVDPGRVYIFGHSIGTIIAPRIALKQPVAGVIAADGVGRSWFEYELSNLRRQLVLDGRPPDEVDAAIRTKELCMHRLLVQGDSESEIERTQPECKEYNDYPASARYMQQAAAMNVAEPWTRLSVPVLAVYGTADFVTAEDDHRRIVDIVNRSHPGTASLRLIPGMDHHFDVAGTQQEAYDLRVKRHGTAPYDTELSATVLEWLCRLERCSDGS